MSLPPASEQHRIAAKVAELMTVCDGLEEQLITTQTENRRLLEAMLDDALNNSQASDSKLELRA